MRTPRWEEHHVALVRSVHVRLPVRRVDTAGVLEVELEGAFLRIREVPAHEIRAVRASHGSVKVPMAKHLSPYKNPKLLRWRVVSGALEVELGELGLFFLFVFSIQIFCFR